MDELDLVFLQKLCKENKIIWSVHAIERMQERSIRKSDIIQVIYNGNIIEQYPKSFPYPACLILGLTINKENLHVVCGCNGEILKIITAYFPNLEKFDESGMQRKEK